MNFTEAFDRAKDLLGPRAAVQQCVDAPSPHERATYASLMPYLLVEYDASNTSLAWHKTNVGIDDTYQIMKEENAKIRDRLDAAIHKSRRYAVEIGIVKGYSFKRMGRGDTFEAAIEDVKRKLGDKR